MDHSKAIFAAGLIEEHLSVNLEQLQSKSKKRNVCDARLVLVGLMDMIVGFESKKMAKFLSRSQPDINYMRRQHHAWYHYNREYATAFNRVRDSYKANLTDLSNIELLETKTTLEMEIRNRALQLIRINNTLLNRGITDTIFTNKQINPNNG